jgi:hypothetical protein
MVGAWQPGYWVALAAISVAAVVAVLGVWLNRLLSRRGRRDEQLQRWRRDAAAALGPMIALLVDAEPSHVLNNSLREYESSRAAVEVLRSRWVRAREPLLVVSLGQVSRELGELGIELQGEVGDLLGTLETAADPSNDLERVATKNEAYNQHASAWNLALQLSRELYR